MTQPHFLNTQPDLTELVEGLHPDPVKHGFEVMFESRLGAPVNALGRIQLNVRVEKTNFLRGFSEVRNAFIPFVWVEEGGGVDDFLATILRVALVYVIDGSQKLAATLAIVGWLVCVAAYIYGVCCPSKRRQLYPRDVPVGYGPRKLDSDETSLSDNESQGRDYDSNSSPRKEKLGSKRRAEQVAALTRTLRAKLQQVPFLRRVAIEPADPKQGSGSVPMPPTGLPPNGNNGGSYQPYYSKRTPNRKGHNTAFADEPGASPVGYVGPAGDDRASTSTASPTPIEQVDQRNLVN